MTKNKSLKRNLLLLGLAFVMLIAFGFSFLAMPSPVSADDTTLPASDSSITITAKRRNAPSADLAPVGQQTDVFDGISYKTFAWENIRNIVVNFDASKASGITENTTGGFLYTYKLEVQYLQARPTTDGHFVIGGNGNNVTEDEKAVVTETGVNTLTNLELSYIVDAETDSTVTYDTHGWGIYRFILTINGIKLRSDFVFIKPIDPTLDEQILPKVHVEYTQSSIINDYDFKISTGIVDDVDYSLYKYIDTSLIRWYVDGIASNGDKYTLVRSDIGTYDFPEDEYKKALYEAEGRNDRTGATFKFNSNGVSGTWKVYCEIYTEPATAENINALMEANPAQSTKADPAVINTGKPIKASYVIWIIVAAAVVLLAIIIVIIVKSVKKEKVW